jgi:hypothetical protein
VKKLGFLLMQDVYGVLDNKGLGSSFIRKTSGAWVKETKAEDDYE